MADEGFVHEPISAAPQFRDGLIVCYHGFVLYRSSVGGDRSISHFRFVEREPIGLERKLISLHFSVRHHIHVSEIAGCSVGAGAWGLEPADVLRSLAVAEGWGFDAVVL